MTEHTQGNLNGTNLHHNIIKLPEGKQAQDKVGERHDIVLLIEVAKSNPNGDPDTGNMPRLQPDTLKGLMTDGCQKRKIRNFLSLYHPNGSLRTEGAQDGYHIFIREGAVLQEQIEDSAVKNRAEIMFKRWFLSEVPEEKRQTVDDAIKGVETSDQNQKKLFNEIKKSYQAAWEGKKQKTTAKSGGESETESTEQSPPEEDTGKKGKGKKQNPVLDDIDKVLKHSPEHRERAWRDALCQFYFDVRYFGGVVSTEGPLKGSFYGQIRGPIQFGYAESLDRVLPLDFSITRCASASHQSDSESDDESSGNRTMGRKHMVDYGIYRSHIFLSPAFAAQTGFTYYDLDNFLFALRHMFTDDKSSSRPGGMRVVGLVDFRHSTALGNEHAHKLFEMVKVSRADKDGNGKPRKEYPQSIEDYCGEAPDDQVREKDQGGEGKDLVVAKRIIWEIPPCPIENPAAQQ